MDPTQIDRQLNTPKYAHTLTDKDNGINLEQSFIVLSAYLNKYGKMFIVVLSDSILQPLTYSMFFVMVIMFYIVLHLLAEHLVEYAL